MNDNKLALEKIRNMEPRHAYLIAKGLNDVYAFFTEENLENYPNKTLEILSNFSLTQTAEKVSEKHYVKVFGREKLEKSNLEMVL